MQIDLIQPGKSISINFSHHYSPGRKHDVEFDSLQVGEMF